MIAQFIQQIQNGIGSAIGLVSGYVNTVTNEIGGRLSDLVASIVPTIQAIVQGVVSSMSGVISDLITSVQSLFAQLQGVFTRLVSDLSDVLSSLWAKIQDVFQSVIGSVSTFLDTITSNIRAVFDGVVGYLKDIVGKVVDEVHSLFSGLWQALQDALSGVWETIKAGFQTFLGYVTQTYQTVISTIQDAWDKLVAGADSALQRVADVLKDVSGEFTKGFAAVGEKIESTAKDVFGPLQKELLDALDAVKEMIDPGTYEQTTAALNDAFAPGTLNLQSPQGLQRFWQYMVPQSDILRPIFMLTVGIFMLKDVTHGILAANADTILQAFNQAHPWRLLDPAEARESYRRDDFTKAQVLDTIRAAGYSAEDAARIIRNSESRPGPNELIQLYLRGELAIPELYAALNVHGLSETWAAQLLKLSQEIPPIDDILRMARRLVFDPSVVSEFGLMDDFQPAVDQWLPKKGLTKFWTDAYWAAHWDLPSVTQGFEMFQRGFIDKGRLDLLFRDAGMAPGWRESLTSIAYHPFTRVDIRRMNKVGSLPDADLPKAYQNIGYSPEDAKTLADFTIKLNAGTKKKGDQALGALTKGSIVSFYQDGLITREKAITLLVGIGQTEEAANLYIANTDALAHAQERKARVSAIVEDAKLGTISLGEAQSRISALALTAAETDRAHAALERAVTQVSKLPDAAQLNDLYKHGLIKDEQYLQTLRSHGLSPEWALLLLNAEKAKLAGTKKH